MPPLILLFIAIFFEVVGTICMRLSYGFEVLWAAGLMVVFYIISFVLFIDCIKKLQLSIAYALWTALGMLAISLISFIFFKEEVTLMKIFALCLITVGVIGLTTETIEEV